jgi:hypothetical protein
VTVWSHRADGRDRADRLTLIGRIACLETAHRLRHDRTSRSAPSRRVAYLAGNVGDMPVGTPGWREMEVAAPQIARLGLARLKATRVAMLGTLRRDGSPRISPVEPCLANGCLLVGAMAWSEKAADLCRDPRYVLHSVITDPDSGEGELKLRGRAVRASRDLRREALGAWWSSQPADKAVVFVLGIDQSLFVEWDTERGVMTVHQWSPQGGYGHRSRGYP